MYNKQCTKYRVIKGWCPFNCRYKILVLPLDDMAHQYKWFTSDFFQVRMISQSFSLAAASSLVLIPVPK